MSLPRLFTLAEVAKHLRVSTRTLRRVVPSVPGLKTIRVGRRLLFEAHEAAIGKAEIDKALAASPGPFRRIRFPTLCLSFVGAAAGLDFGAGLLDDWRGMSSRGEQSPQPLAAGTTVFACAVLGAFAAMMLHPLLPDTHQTQATGDLVRTAIGVVGVITSLVLSLLIFSAKGSFDTIDRELRQFAADLILVDRMLRRFGAKAAEPRALLARYVADVIAGLWPGYAEGEGSCIRTRPATDEILLERVAVLITAVTADDECERMLQSRALTVCGDLLRQRWLIIEQQCNLVHPPFVILIAAWTSVLFTGFGYLSPQNAVCVLALLASAASVAGAVVLILDLIRPFSGFIRVPSRPMRQALEFLRLPEPPKFRETGATLTVDHGPEAVSLA